MFFRDIVHRHLQLTRHRGSDVRMRLGQPVIVVIIKYWLFLFVKIFFGEISSFLEILRPCPSCRFVLGKILFTSWPRSVLKGAKLEVVSLWPTPVLLKTNTFIMAMAISDHDINIKVMFAEDE